jgi:hypothetical protein
MQLVVDQAAAVITFSSNQELAAKVKELVGQLAKLPPSPTGRKRSFERHGLAIRILLPVWNELLALKAAEQHKALLSNELTSRQVYIAPAPDPDFSQELYAELSALKVKQLRTRLESAGKKLHSKATKAELVEALMALA